MAKTLKPEIIINVYILTDGQGEWWESLKIDGSTNRFQNGSDEYLKDKTFKTPEAALAYGKGRFNRFQVIRQDPPSAPSRTWNETILHDIGRTA